MTLLAALAEPFSRVLDFMPTAQQRRALKVKRKTGGRGEARLRMRAWKKTRWGARRAPRQRLCGR